MILFLSIEIFFIVSQPLPDYNKLKEKLLQELLSKVTRKKYKKNTRGLQEFFIKSN